MCQPGSFTVGTVGIPRRELEPAIVGCSDTAALATCRHRHAIEGRQCRGVARQPEHGHTPRLPRGRSAA